MTTLFHYYGEDLKLDLEGGLLTTTGALAVRQALFRRLCTNPKAYLWHVEYGAGLPARVGMPIREMETRALITSQLSLEEAIDQKKPVAVSLTATAIDRFVCNIAYTEKDLGTLNTLEINQDGMI